MASVRKILERNPVRASAPCRVDSGGTWDIKAMALPMAPAEPVTVNMALTLRTTVDLSPWDDGWIRISSAGFRSRTFKADRLSFTPPFGLFLAAASCFGYHGMEIRIRSRSPVKSALGGSSTALVALVRALCGVRAMLDGKKFARPDILHLSYHLEDAVAGGNCGLQDQAAAVYGGVHQWLWHYGHRTRFYKRIPLLDRAGRKELSERFLLAYTGKSHVSVRTNRKWVREFLSGQGRKEWLQSNRIVHRLGDAILKRDWESAAARLREETDLRRRLTPEAFIPLTERLVDLAEKTGCGARFAGAGAGGCVWALGKRRAVFRLRKAWEETLAPVKNARIIPCAIDAKGVQLCRPS